MLKKWFFGFILFFTFSTLSAAEIAVITIASGDEYQKSVKLGTESKENYCKRHGYDFIFCDHPLDDARHVYWSKILLAQNVMKDPKYKWVVWLDADTLIMNQDIPLEDLIDENVNFLIGMDWNGINSGVFFIRNCNWSSKFLDEVYSRTDCLNLRWPEQLAIGKVLNEKAEYSTLAKIVPQRLFNSYPEEASSSLMSTYQPGDFLIHFASIHNLDNLAGCFEKYSKKVLNDRKLVGLDQYLGYYGFCLTPLHSENNEGYMSNEQKQQYIERLSKYPNIKSIMEIGLNGGHSADNFFKNCPNLQKFVSFDINMHPYTQPAADYFKRVYKDKFQFVQGDSALTVPFYKLNFPKEKFDLIYVDGKHTYEYVIQDILNSKQLAHENTILWVDDYGSFIQEAVQSLQQKGVLKVVHVQNSMGEHGGRSWAEARFIFP